MSLSNVTSSLQGLIGSHDGLQLLTGRNCITRRDNNPADGRVKLISGGGSGHEPAHAGYVGRGMLTGAVCGNIFSSPSVTAILDCLRTVATPGKAEVVFIVKNYTGDRLNFGIAVERSAALGYRDVRMLLVGEDCSIEQQDVRKSVGKRGLAGVVLVHKILGALAEQGHGVQEVLDFGEGLVRSENLATIGFTFEQKDGSLEDIEIGKGIHGEPGVYKMEACGDFEPIVDFLIGKLSKNVPKASEVVLLINNLGGTSEFLMGIFVKNFLKKIEGFYIVKRVYCGTFLSSLDQSGVSVTVLNLGYSAKLLEYLDQDVHVPSMLFGRSHLSALQPSTEIQVPTSEIQTSSNIKTSRVTEKFGAKLASTIITFVCEALVSCTDMLNTIDKEAGDGDTGSTLGRGAAAILEHLNAGKLDLVHPAQLLQQISVILEQDMGGSSGALYSLFFQGAAKVFYDTSEPSQTVTIKHWADCLSKGSDTIVKYALTELSDRTMLDPLREGELRIKKAIDQALPVLECVEQFTKGCEEAARATQSMVPKSGRAAYGAASETPKQYQYPDPGAHAVSIWARALLEACKQVVVE